MLKVVECFWILEIIDFAIEHDQYLNDFFKVRIVFETTLEGGGRYVVARQGKELETLLREFAGSPVQGNYRKKLRACRKKPALLVLDSAGKVAAILPREG